MASRMKCGDPILIDHFAYPLGQVRRSDIVGLSYPLYPSLDDIKRGIGVHSDDLV